MCAVISVPSANVGSSELSVTAEWATLAAEQPAAAQPSSKLTEQHFVLKQTTWSEHCERWITYSAWFVTLPKIHCMKALYHRGMHHSELS